MKAIIIFITSIFLAIAGKANNNPEKGGVISGVVQGANNEPMPFATVALHQSSDKKLVTGSITDESGGYRLKEVSAGEYYLVFGFIGYHNKTSESFQITKGQRYTAAVTQLTPNAKQLEMAEITAEQSVMETHIDKKVFNVAKSSVVDGGTGADVLRITPGVDVDANDQITLRGDGNVTILVNGRPMPMSAMDYLKQTPASAIDRIEIITNPSAKYDAEGMSGILNIVLKKNGASGFNGSVNGGAGYGVTEKVNGGMSLNFKNDKYSIRGTINGDYRPSYYEGNLTRELGTSKSVEQSILDQGQREGLAKTATVGIDYFLNDNNTLYIESTGSLNPSISERLFTYGIVGDETAQHSTRKSVTDDWSTGLTLNGGWQHKFEKPGHNLDFDVVLNRSTMLKEETSLFSYTNGYQTLGAPQSLYTNNDLLVEGTVAKVDYVYPINDSLRFEAGAKFTGDRYNNAFDNGRNDIETVADAFIYSRGILASYAILNKQYKKLGWQAGVRYEETMTTSEVKTEGTAFENDFGSFFPSAHVNYKFNPKFELTGSYSKRTNRPSIQEIFPFQDSSDPYVVMIGNPFLKPEFIDVFEIGSTNYIKGVRLTSNVYYRNLTDRKSRFLEPMTADGVSVVSQRNFSGGHTKGVELGASFAPHKAWRTMINANYWSSVTEDAGLSESLDFETSGWSMQLNSSLRMKKYTLQLTGRYNGEMPVLQGVILPRYGMDLGVRVPVLKGKGTLGVRMSDVFNTREFRFKSNEGANQQFSTSRQWESQQYWLTFRYNFGKKINNKKRSRGQDHNANDNSSAPSM